MHIWSILHKCMIAWTMIDFDLCWPSLIIHDLGFLIRYLLVLKNERWINIIGTYKVFRISFNLIMDNMKLTEINSVEIMNWGKKMSNYFKFLIIGGGSLPNKNSFTLRVFHFMFHKLLTTTFSFLFNPKNIQNRPIT